MRNDCPVCLSPDADVHRWVHHHLDVLAETQAQLLEARLQVADGPRARVLELERTVMRLNDRIARQNGKARK